MATWQLLGSMTVTLITTVAAFLGGAQVIARPLRKVVRQQDEFREDWYGQPARPGRPPQPGVMERLAAIEGRIGRLEGGGP